MDLGDPGKVPFPRRNVRADEPGPWDSRPSTKFRGATHFMDGTDALPIRSFLAQRASEGATAEMVANTIESVWRQISGALAPVIGKRGVAALYKRSLHLAGESHPWLGAAAQAAAVAEMDLALLRAELMKRPSAEAAAAGATLLLSFYGLIGSLIGPALSGQLLDGVWATFFSGSPAQDPSP